MSEASDQSGSDLEQFRSYLNLLARLQLDPQPGARLEASDLVQQTLLKAHRQWDQFRGESDGELAAWLKQILGCQLADALRAVHRQKRDISRELSLEQTMEQSPSRLESCLQAEQSSPSSRAERNEQLARMAAVLDELCSDQREAIVLHHLQGLSLAETAQRLDRTTASVAGLLRRGLRRLRERLAESDSSS